MGTDVLRAWEWPGSVRAEDADGGLINHTWWVRGPSGTVAVMQRLNTRIFRPEVHEDIEAVTTRVAERGLPTPRLIRTREGTLFHTDRDGDVYRCLTVVGERTVHKLSDPAEARSAARFLARFHAAIRDLDWDFRMRRPGAHDTEVHFRRLREALEQHRGHRLYDDVSAVAEQVLGGWEADPSAAPLPVRVIHGDPKISNLRFVGPDAMALVDLDTFARGTIEIELGDAMRSWCNPGTEGSLDSRFDLEMFEAAMSGYGEGAGEDGLTDAEWDSIVPGVLRISWELAARFAQDALAEAYFGFDPAYGGRGEHNLLRARGQAQVAASLRSQRAAADAAVARARRPA